MTQNFLNPYHPPLPGTASEPPCREGLVVAIHSSPGFHLIEMASVGIIDPIESGAAILTGLTLQTTYS
jgi:hypothetical protein